jgi:hypothetical protein
MANFYAGPSYDFHHVRLDLTPDGQWHPYEVTVPTGDFPFPVGPSLRLWVYPLPGPVWVDDIELQPLTPPTALKPSKVETLD